MSCDLGRLNLRKGLCITTPFFPGKLGDEPCPRHSPVTLYGIYGNTQSFRRLLHGQTSEVTQFDYPALATALVQTALESAMIARCHDSYRSKSCSKVAILTERSWRCA